MKVIYIVGAMYYANGMAKILTDKINWLVKHTDFQIVTVGTERADLPNYYPLDTKVKSVNFNLDFDSINSLSMFKRIIASHKKNKELKKLLTRFLIDEKADVVITTMRREINFINDIPDGSIKIGEMHFGRSHYRSFNKKSLPPLVNKAISSMWQKQLLKEIRRLKRFVVLTNEDKLAWSELDNIAVIPNFLSSVPQTTSSCKNKKVIAVGRYTLQKGFDYLFKAWRNIERNHNDWELELYGSGNHEQYQYLADAEGLKNVICHPATKEITRVYESASIFVLSSRHEGFGLVLIEAQSYGLPVVAFDCPCGPKDIINDGVNGLLVPCYDTDELSEKIEYLIADEAERRRIGANAKENVKRYHIDAIMGKWVELFNSLK